jgi:hypothetical protein
LIDVEAARRLQPETCNDGEVIVINAPRAKTHLINLFCSSLVYADIARRRSQQTNHECVRLFVAQNPGDTCRGCNLTESALGAAQHEWKGSALNDPRGVNRTFTVADKPYL